MPFFRSLRLLILFAALFAQKPAASENFRKIESTFQPYADRAGGILVVQGLIKAPADLVWDVLVQKKGRTKKACTHTGEVMDFSIRKIKENEFRAYYKFDFPWPLKNRWQVIHIRHERETGHIYWKLIEGTIRKNTGLYHITNHNGNTKVRYEVEFDPGIDFLPEAFLRFIVKKEAPESLKKLRKCVYRQLKEKDST